jgi:tetratricopeptide (TPR) repeat protein
MTRLLITVVFLAALGCKRAPQVPDISLAGIDPVVATQISNTVAEVKAAPGSGGAWGKLGMVLKSAGLQSHATNCFARAEQLDPKNPRWPYFIGTGDSFQRALALAGPDQLAVRLHLAQSLAEAGHWAEAEEQFRAAGHALGLGQIAAAQGKWAAAAPHLEQARQDRYSAKTATELLAATYLRLGRTNESRALSAQAAAMPPDPSRPNAFDAELKQYATGKRAWIGLAQDLLGQKRVAEAMPAIERLVTLYPDAAESWLYLGRASLLQSNLPVAEQALSRHLQLDPQSVDGHMQMGLVYHRQDRVPEAAAEFQKVLQSKPDSENAHYFLGLIQRRMGDNAAAIKSFQQALRCDPNFEPARKALERMTGDPR